MRRRGWPWALAAGVICALSLAPFAWLVLASFKTPLEITAIPPVPWPSGGLESYHSALSRFGLGRFVLNSLIVAGATTLGSLALGTGAAYALARLRLPGRPWLMGGLLLVSMFPQISLAGPIWRMLQAAGLLNTHLGLIIPYITLTLPLAVWILTSYFSELPRELEEAALLDGCGRLGALWRVILPLAGPGLFTAAILVFIYAWNEFFFALLIMTRRSVQTLPVGIAMFQGQYTMPWGEIAAASTVATVPLVVLVFLFQRRIVGGLSAGAIKG